MINPQEIFHSNKHYYDFCRPIKDDWLIKEALSYFEHTHNFLCTGQSDPNDPKILQTVFVLF